MSNSPILTAIVAFVLAAAATPLVRAFARRIGAVAAPRKDRWHSAPTAMMGGVAIFVAVIVTIALLLPRGTENLVVILASTALFALGLIDDFLHLKPYQKLIGQLLGASAVVYFGLVLPWTGSFTINMLITFFWLIGVTNAVNMLDNMDGLAAGVSAIAAAALAVTFYLNGQMVEAAILAAFLGGLLGFLLYNHNPASIFMGDGGSMFVGFFLASGALLASQGGGGRSRSVIAVLAVPLLVLSIPIFDTTFVTLMRKMAGRPASQGGRDHTSHRLVALGLSERSAVWMLYAFAALGGALAIAVRQLSLDVSVAIITAFAIVIGMLGVYLGNVRVYNEGELPQGARKPMIAILFDLSQKGRVFEVALDVLLIVQAHYFAYAIVFGPASASSSDWALFLRTIPVIVFAKLVGFTVGGVYRGLWRYASISDAIAIIRGTLFGSALAVLVLLFAFRFDGFSRTVFVIDGILLMMFAIGSRFAFRLMQRAFPAPHTRTGTRVLIFGAGDGGVLLCRELRNNPALQRMPVAFFDDDERKSGKVLHGLRVYSATDGLAETCERLQVKEVIVSTHLEPARLRDLASSCSKHRIPLRRLRVALDRVSDLGLGSALGPESSEADASPILSETLPISR